MLCFISVVTDREQTLSCHCNYIKVIVNNNINANLMFSVRLFNKSNGYR